MKTTTIVPSGDLQHDWYHSCHLCRKVKIQRKRNRKIKSNLGQASLGQLTGVVPSVSEWTVKPRAATEKWVKWNPDFYSWKYIFKKWLSFMHNVQQQNTGKQFCLNSVYIECNSFKNQWNCQLWVWSFMAEVHCYCLWWTQESLALGK